jgi:dual specificity protein kinase YAK1
VKIIKNRPAYYNAAMNEIRVLQVIQARLGSKCKSIILLETSFLHQSHLCLVFEVLGINLYEMLKKNQFRGLSMDYLRAILTQLIEATRQLHSLQIIHCDLKPENILLKVASSEPSHQSNATSTTTNSSSSSATATATTNPTTTNHPPNKE